MTKRKPTLQRITEEGFVDTNLSFELHGCLSFFVRGKDFLLYDKKRDEVVYRYEILESKDETHYERMGDV